MSSSLKHLLQLEGISTELFTVILNKAQSIIDNEQDTTIFLDDLKDATVCNLFFETSTRTRVSFELAAKRLGAEVINIDGTSSAIQKGESILDTIYTLKAMHCDFFILRASEDGIVESVANNVNSNISIINAGDGTHAHPTQGLLDMLAIRQHKGDIAPLSIAIVGDIEHSRVARSDIAGLKILGCQDIRLVGPKEFLPNANDITGVTYHENFAQGIQDTDAIIMLRIQKERMQSTSVPDLTQYHASYGLNAQSLKSAKPDAIVMHPGPMNRGIEIDADVADGPQSVIQQQVTNGVAIRMAVLSMLASNLSTV